MACAGELASPPSPPGPHDQLSASANVATREGDVATDSGPLATAPGPSATAAGDPGAGGSNAGPSPVAMGSSPAPAASSQAVTEIIKIKHAPFGEHPRVLVHAPADLRDGGPLSVVIFLHGWYGCVQVVGGSESAPCRPGQPTRVPMDVVKQHDAAGTASLLVIPQLSYDVPSSAPGRFVERGLFASMLDDVLAHPALSGVIPAGTRARDIGRIVIFAHSGAYKALGQIVARGGVTVHEVHLLDALYEDVPELRGWGKKAASDLATGQRRLTITYTEGEKTGARSKKLVADIAAMVPGGSSLVWDGEAEGDPPPEALEKPLVTLKTGDLHEAIPRRMVAPLVRSAKLRAR